MAPYKALYGRKYCTPICWDEVGERKILGPEIIQMMIDKVWTIRQRMKEAQNIQKKVMRTIRGDPWNSKREIKCF
jgi:hypothetical protein